MRATHVIRLSSLLSIIAICCAARTATIASAQPGISEWSNHTPHLNAPAPTTDDARRAAYLRMQNTRLSVDFASSPLRDVVAFLAAVSGIDFIADWDERGLGGGLDPERQITLKVRHELALASIIDLVLSQAMDDPGEASWMLGDGFVRIGLKDTLNRFRTVRVYPVHELLFEIPQFDNGPEMDLESVLGGGTTGEITGTLFSGDEDDEPYRMPHEDQAIDLIDLVTTMIEPDQWERHGGDGGSIRYLRGVLVVNAADYLHRQLGGYEFEPSDRR